MSVDFNPIMVFSSATFSMKMWVENESWYLAIASINMYQRFTGCLIRSSPLWLSHFAILSLKNLMFSRFIWFHYPRLLGVATDSTRALTEFGFAAHGHYAWGPGKWKASNGTGSFWDFTCILWEAVAPSNKQELPRWSSLAQVVKQGQVMGKWWFIQLRGPCIHARQGPLVWVRKNAQKMC